MKSKPKVIQPMSDEDIAYIDARLMEHWDLYASFGKPPRKRKKKTTPRSDNAQKGKVT